jgi:hypothetical protein
MVISYFIDSQNRRNNRQEISESEGKIKKLPVAIVGSQKNVSLGLMSI